jgi:putative ABC transport system permease protein
MRQMVAITDLNVKGLRDRLWSSLVIVVGMACVVAVLLSMLSFSTGLSDTIRAAGDPGRAIVVAKGAMDEFGQGVSRAATVSVQSAPGIRRGEGGQPMVSAESLTNVPIFRKADRLPVRVVLRGIGPQGLAIRPEFRLVDGRMFAAGTHELIVGTAARAQFADLDIGSKVSLPDGEWTVVGAFETGGDVIEGQLLGEIDTVLASRRLNGYGSVIARLESPDTFDAFKATLAADPALNVDIERQSDFYARGVGQFTLILSGIAYFLGGIMAVGALFGTLNTMYSAVATRTREIATLRAIGFGGAPVAVSVLVESFLLAAAGALLGIAIAWLLFNGNRNSMGNTVFNLAVTPRVMLVGVSWAIVIAFLGGIFPAVRAARLPVVTALRAA